MVRRSQRNIDVQEQNRRKRAAKQKFRSAERELRDALAAVWKQGDLNADVVEVIEELLGGQYTIALEDDRQPSHNWLTRKRGFSLVYGE